MISVIIYEDDKEMEELYQETIRKFFELRRKKVKFYIFPFYTRNLENKFKNIPGKKIYILDIEVEGKSGLDLARMIRSNGDWMSPLIVVTSYEHLRNTGFTSKILMLDFISKKENVKLKLRQSLETVCNILQMKDFYTFQYDGKLFHIPFEDTLYFEKDSNDNYTFMYTKNNCYKIKESITQIEKKLKYQPNFLKIHRSCIVNTNQISTFHLKEKRIYFGKYSTNLITREHIDSLKKSLNPLQIIK